MRNRPALRLYLSAWMLVIASVLGCSAGADGPLELTFLGNEGFLLRGGGKSVLIDALSGEGLRGYVPVPVEPRAKLEAALPPFGQVDLVLATHAHADHFDARSVGKYLTLAPDALFVSTEQSVGLLELHVADYAGFKARVQGLAPEDGKRIKLKPSGIALQAFPLTHGNTANLGFLIELGGKKVLHVGDTDAGADFFAQYGLPRDRIDIALIPFWMLVSEEGRATVRDHVGAAQVVAMHVPAPSAQPRYFGESLTAVGLYADLEEAWPGIILLREPLGTHTFP